MCVVHECLSINLQQKIMLDKQISHSAYIVCFVCLFVCCFLFFGLFVFFFKNSNDKYYKNGVFKNSNDKYYKNGARKKTNKSQNEKSCEK